jgi:hypothetical protein
MEIYILSPNLMIIYQKNLDWNAFVVHTPKALPRNIIAISKNVKFSEWV